MVFKPLPPNRQARGAMRVLVVIAWVCVLVGTPVALWGLYHGLKPLVETYQQAMTDPLADKMPEDGAQIGREMVKSLPIGLVGAILATLGGSFLFSVFVRGVFRRLRGKSEA